MRKILFAIVVLFLIGAAFLAATKIVPGINLKKNVSGQGATNLQSVVQIDGTNLSLAQNGTVLPKTNSKDPVLFLSKNTKLKQGDKVTDPQTLFAVNIAAQIAKSDFSAAGIRLLDLGDVAVYNTQNAIAIFTSRKDLSAQIDSLQQVLAKAKIDATKISKIDLRYNLPVITFK